MQKTAVITGSSAGIGFQAARSLAELGFEIIIAARSIEKGKAAAATIGSEFPKSKTRVLQLELSDFESIRNFASNLDCQWDILLNNAGAKIEKPAKTTAQNFEWHVGVNHLGHFALTADIWPLAKTTATVVTVSSIVAHKGNLDWNQEKFPDERSAYASSKLMNYAFAEGLAKRLEGTSRKSIAAHPGFTRASAYGNRLIRVGEYIAAQSAEAGSRPILQAIDSPNGSYLAPRVLELWGKPSEARKPRIKQERADEFWDWSEKSTGRVFNP
jgi:NAD(P)-dependent dehydrogenase (short-subunit alcohol dehydrogenase family)